MLIQIANLQGSVLFFRDLYKPPFPETFDFGFFKLTNFHEISGSRGSKYDGGFKLLWNVVQFLRACTAKHRRIKSSLLTDFSDDRVRHWSPCSCTLPMEGVSVAIQRSDVKRLMDQERGCQNIFCSYRSWISCPPPSRHSSHGHCY
jgi:hypothetical protein